MYIIYLLEFKNTDEIYIGLSNNLNWQLEIEEKFFKIEYNLELSSVKVLTFPQNQKDAFIDKDMWIEKTKDHNINSKFTENIPDTFISKSLKDKNDIQIELKKLESKYISLYYEYRTMRENSSNLNELVESVIQENIENWKDSELKITPHLEEKYDSNGYDRFGYNEDGFDKNGYGRDGFDSSGLDKDGYDKNGYDIYLLDRNGYDKDGFDKDGNERVVKVTKKPKKSNLYYDDHGFDQNGKDHFGRHCDDITDKNVNTLEENKEIKSKSVKKKNKHKIGTFSKEHYFNDGYNWNGLDREGYDRQGYNKEEFNKNGFDQNGNKCKAIK